MKTLLSLITFLVLCAGAAAWQQQSINSLREEIARLSNELMQTRTALESDQTRITKLNQQLRQLRSNAFSGGKDISVTDDSPLPNPQSEGWWPTNKPYFYLPKGILETVRFRHRALKRDQLPPGFPKDMEHVVSNRLFENNRLNENMVALLGMTEAEKTSVEETYSNLREQVHALESAAIQRVDPPRSNDTSGAVFARIPALTSEVAPLVKQAVESLKQTLGPERAGLLAHQAEIHFNQDHDGLGNVTREFLQNGGGLSVRYIDSRGSTSFRSQTFPYVPNRNDEWEYLHLFGPNGPIQLK